MFEIKPKKFKKILVGVDDAPDARAAFSYAVDKAKRDGSELGIVSILETDRVNVYQILDKDYVHSSEDELRQRVNEYVQAAIDYGVDPEKITAIVDRGERPAERICNHVIPAFQPDLLVVGSIGKKGNRKAVGSQASYMARHAGISVFVIRTNTVQAYE
ncbi:universal stress protein [Limosilactobacillus agrestis]|uniref:Universal stress protein n=1 Tax=Limosilactobacillus agrestis TaxID=2759748 RepID=A0A7W3UHQ7_9LACO|nr:universal stress protein [Limosilactobacillus agrestis]MBD5090968.1 universal stress protein [Lactobacillus sp.]MBB1095831.1 universal stress protein [Limosilactobacillus agrestis]MBB1098848.1 universal stress protein [Limosilactobacillus agrestis]MCD7113533.1 universal stress protein [Limosilactobacillus agrestis]MCD7119965.1 universal stress protein [Limosilactobacillus agrestis]